MRKELEIIRFALCKFVGRFGDDNIYVMEVAELSEIRRKSHSMINQINHKHLTPSRRILNDAHIKIPMTSSYMSSPAISVIKGKTASQKSARHKMTGSEASIGEVVKAAES